MRKRDFVFKIFSLALLLLFSYPSLCNGDLVAWYFNSTINITFRIPLVSYYSTLGGFPEVKSMRAPATFISGLNVTNDCRFKIEDNDITGRVLIFLDDQLPPFYGCNRHLGGPAVTFARMAQSIGVVGIVIKEQEDFLHGRMTGVNSEIIIPFVVVPDTSYTYLKDNQGNITSLEFSIITDKEKKEIADIVRDYNGLRFASAGIYFIAIIMLAYILYIDILRLQQRRKKMSHSVAMKMFGVTACLAAFIWLMVDPFYFEPIYGWYPYFCMKVHTGFFTIDFIFILRLSGKAASRATKTIIPYRVLLWIIYPLIAWMLIIMAVCGVLWYMPFFVVAFYYSQIIVFGICGLGFILYGRDIYVILSKSGHAAPHRNGLPIRIVVFIACFIIEVYTGNMLNLAGTLGLVFGLLFNFFMNGLGFVAIFLILFCQPSKLKPKIPKSMVHSPKTSPQVSPRSVEISMQDLTAHK